MNGFMEKLTSALEKYMTPFANKVSSIKFLQAIARTMTAILPVTVVGGFACLFAFMDIPFWTAFLGKFPALQVMFMTIQSLTLSIISLYVVIILPYRYCQQLEVENALGGIVINLASFLLVTPTELYANIPCAWLGHKGMFTAFIVSYVTTRIYALFYKKGFTIKMPESVPSYVGDSLASLIPALVIVPLFGILGAFMSTTSFGSIHQLIYDVIQAPLQNVGSTFPSFLLFGLTATLSFFCGIHGQSTTAAWVPIYQANNMVVIDEIAAGATRNSVIFNSGTMATMYMGGMTMTLGATILVAFIMRSKRMKTVGRVAIGPQLFNIGEPILFGLPIMLNPAFLLPVVLSAIANATISWVTCAAGFVVYTGLDPSWTIPMIIKSFFISTTPIQCALVQAIILVVDMVIWYPFLKMQDRKFLSEEAAEEPKSVE